MNSDFQSPWMNKLAKDLIIKIIIMIIIIIIINN